LFVILGSSGFLLASGETSTGCPVTKVGCTKCSSQNSSNISDNICPLVIPGLTSNPLALATAIASSSVLIVEKSTSAYNLTASAISSLLQGGVKSISLP